MLDIIITPLVSLLLLALYALLVLLIMIFFSIVIAGLVMLIVPIACIFLLPDVATQFLAVEQHVFLDGTVAIYNLHVLLFIWASLLSVIISTRFITWYIMQAPTRPAARARDTTSKTSSIPVLDLSRIKETFTGLTGRGGGKPTKKTPEKEEGSKFAKQAHQGGVNLGPLNAPLMKLEEFIDNIMARIMGRE